MFGYITADVNALSDEEKNRYRSFYCGLCRCIGSEYGMLHRLMLNYDLTFLTILLSSLYEPAETELSGRCLIHPRKIQPFVQTDATSYSAAMTIALSYHKCLDDWKDDRRISSKACACVLRKAAVKVAARYPGQWSAIESCMSALSRLEQENCQEPDLGANLFAQLMETLFLWRCDRWAPELRKIGAALGRFIYLMDAVLDLEEDLRCHRYNPFSSRAEQELLIGDYFPVFQMLMGECCDAFEALPLIQDTGLLRNILYSGVWTRYHNYISKEHSHVR